MKEIWKDIKGYKGIYQVSNTGKVRSKSRVVKNLNSGIVRHIKGHLLKQTDTVDHYYQITLSKNGHKNNYNVHDLVAKAFVKNTNPSVNSQINHKNANRHDNRASNLEWCTAKYNINYGNHNLRVINHWHQHTNYYALIVGHGFFKVFTSMRQAAVYVHNNYGGSIATNNSHMLSMASGKSRRRHIRGFIAGWYKLPLSRKFEAQAAKLMIIQSKTMHASLVHKKSPRIELRTDSFSKIFDTANSVRDWLIKNKYTHANPVSVRNAVTAVCRGKRKHCYGFSAKYLK